MKTRRRAPQGLSQYKGRPTFSRELTALYDELNRRFFRGRLRRCTVSLVSFRFYSQEGCCDDEKGRILIDRAVADSDQRRVLLHEMCHIRTPGHGARFRAKLARLAKMGEAWAEAERRQYEEACRLELPLTAQIRHALEEIAVEQPSLRWPAVRRLVAAEVLHFAHDVDRVAPWAPKVWARVKAEALEQRRQPAARADSHP